jgi:hypothetical protein
MKPGLIIQSARFDPVAGGKNIPLMPLIWQDQRGSLRRDKSGKMLDDSGQFYESRETPLQAAPIANQAVLRGWRLVLKLTKRAPQNLLAAADGWFKNDLNSSLPP